MVSDKTPIFAKSVYGESKINIVAQNHPTL